MRKPQSRTYAIAGGPVFDGRDFPADHAVIIHEETIRALVPASEIPAGMETISADGAIVAPGFVDLQLNGCGGVTFTDSITAEALDRMHAANLKSGCTAFLPTLVSTAEADMLAAMRLVREYRARRGPAPVLGLHLEGPYISRARKGIHNEAHIKALTPAMRDALCAYAGAAPLVLTLAPECVDADDIRALADAGVIVSIGHTNAAYEEAKRGIRAGARAATHLFNAMSPWQSREPGAVGAIFDSPDVACGIIADGAHSHFASVALAKRLKRNKCFLITDGTAPVGTDMTEFSFCGQTVYVRDGMCLNADGTLGGSRLTMIEAVRNCVVSVGIPLAEALRMASAYPAALMGQEALMGNIVPGAYANLALFFPDTFAMAATVDRGAMHIWKY